MDSHERSQPLFHEEQSFGQLRLRLMLALPPAALSVLLVWQVVLGHPWGKQPMSNGGLIGLTVFLWLVYLRLTRVRLVTNVEPGELLVGLRGLWRMRRIPLTNLKAVKIVTFHPLRDFGGYGIRSLNRGKAYVAGGTRGVRLELNDDSVLVIGSNRPEELSRVLRPAR
jgi:hypothetical protein